MHDALILWYILTAFSLVFVIYDQMTNTPTMRVMKAAWFLAVMYIGPVGLFLYLLSCRQPMPGTHDAFIKPHWKQAFGSELHCVAGDATGIILSALLLYQYGLPNGLESIYEYIAAYLVGLFVFQALFMRVMFPSYLAAVKKTVFVETLSMNFVMGGMLPVVMLLRYHYPLGVDPRNLEFWGIMSVATMVGFVFAYPVNSWMVKRGIKHGMMSKGMDMPNMPGMRGMHAEHESLSLKKQIIYVSGSFVFLFAVTWVVSLWVPINF